MPKSMFVNFKAVKSSITMERVLEKYGILGQFKRSGDSLSGPCPIHKGSNPTQFRVSISKNIFNCFSECKHGGNVLDFIAKMEGCSVHAAALKAIEWFKIDPEAVKADSTGSEKEDESGEEPEPRETPAPKPAPTKPIAKEEPSAPNKPLKFRLDKLERQHPYLTETRGLTLETITDFGIGFCSKGMMADRIAIPIHNVKGEVMAYIGRFPGEPEEGTPKYKLPPGFKKTQELFNIDRAVKEPEDDPLVIVEGVFDCMKLHQNDCRKVVALMGSSMSEAQERLILEKTTRDTQIIIMLDEDESGRMGRDDIACRLAKWRFVRVHVFDMENMQPESITPEELQYALGVVLRRGAR